MQIATDTFFTDFITNGASAELWFCVFVALNLVIIYMGVENGIERVSKFMMPILLVLALIISAYSITRPGAMAGVSYMLIPHLENFSWMTVVSAMGQMFYSLSIAMGLSNGPDVLLAVHRHGYPDHLRILYEEGSQH